MEKKLTRREATRSGRMSTKKAITLLREVIGALEGEPATVPGTLYNDGTTRRALLHLPDAVLSIHLMTKGGAL